MIYITGDTHGSFSRIEEFCNKNKTTKDDILIILGDAGINIRGEILDRSKKELLESLPITLFMVHGNHEQRPKTIYSYKEILFHGGIVYCEEQYPSLLFAKDGELFDFNGLKTIVIGGAYSVDKFYRIINGLPWFSDEQPSQKIKDYVEKQLSDHSWKMDIVLSHTGPRSYEPVEMFIEGLDQSRVDKTTEDWLDEIETRLEYKHWYYGHYHCEKKVDNIEILFEKIEQFFDVE